MTPTTKNKPREFYRNRQRERLAVLLQRALAEAGKRRINEVAEWHMHVETVKDHVRAALKIVHDNLC